MLCILGFFSVVLGALTNLYKARETEHFKKVYKGKCALLCHWGYMMVIVTIYTIYAFCTPVMDIHPRWGMFAFSATFLQGTFYALVSVASLECYMPFRRSNVLSWILILAQVASYQLPKYLDKSLCDSLHLGSGPLFDDYQLVVGLNIIGYTAVFHQIFWMLIELKTICNVRIFHIKDISKLA